MLRSFFRSSLCLGDRARASDSASKAYGGYRNLFIQRNFGWFAAFFLAVVVYIIYTEYRYIKSVRQLEK